MMHYQHTYIYHVFSSIRCTPKSASFTKKLVCKLHLFVRPARPNCINKSACVYIPRAIYAQAEGNFNIERSSIERH